MVGCTNQRIVFINRFFSPDYSATSQMLSDLAFYLAQRGERVHVITSRQRYDNADARLPRHEFLQNVEVHRVRTTRFGRRWLPGRATDYLSFYVSAGWKLLQLTTRDDVVVAKTDPPMLSVLVNALMPLRRLQLVNWLQDLYPEIAAELGVMGGNGRAGRYLVAIRNWSLRGTAMNVAIGEDMALRLRAMGVPQESTCVIQNWADDTRMPPIASATNPLRQRWGLHDKFVVAYSGNLGRAHDVETVLGAAEKLNGRRDIVFLFIGSGHGISELGAEARKRGLAQVHFQPYQPRELLSQSLGVGDVHWLSLKAGFDGLILPSKFYGIAAAERPIIVVGSHDGELSRLVNHFDCGVNVGLGCSDDLARIIVLLADDLQRCRQMGQNARAMLEQKFTKKQALERWHLILRSAAAFTQGPLR